MQDRIIARLDREDEAHLAVILEALRRTAATYRDRYPTRTKALREALKIAAEKFAAAE